MKSIDAMIKQLNGLTNTNDLTTWENEFVLSVCEKDSKLLSGKQVEIVERIYKKHFAD